MQEAEAILDIRRHHSAYSRPIPPRHPPRKNHQNQNQFGSNPRRQNPQKYSHSLGESAERCFLLPSAWKSKGPCGLLWSNNRKRKVLAGRIRKERPLRVGASG